MTTPYRLLTQGQRYQIEAGLRAIHKMGCPDAYDSACFNVASHGRFEIFVELQTRKHTANYVTSRWFNGIGQISKSFKLCWF